MRCRSLIALLAGNLLLAASTGSSAPKAKVKSNPAVEIVTSLGKIEVELYPDRAPKTVENFLAYVKSGFYNGTIFHRVIADFMIQGGGYDAAYHKKPTRAAISNEADNGLKNDRGTLAMARTPDPHSATAQFFINVQNNEALNYRSKDAAGWGYCVFGRVTQGMDTVDKIRAVRTGAKGTFTKDAPLKEVVIQKTRRL